MRDMHLPDAFFKRLRHSQKGHASLEPDGGTIPPDQNSSLCGGFWRCADQRAPPRDCAAYACGRGMKCKCIELQFLRNEPLHWWFLLEEWMKSLSFLLVLPAYYKIRMSFWCMEEQCHWAGRWWSTLVGLRNRVIALVGNIQDFLRSWTTTTTTTSDRATTTTTTTTVLITTTTDYYFFFY